jgi:hypothetical protein
MSESTLVTLDRLRARARQDRQGYAFPLFLFGALILAAPLLYTNAPYVDYFDGNGFDPRREGGNVLVQLFRTTARQDPANPTLVACYWLAVLVGGCAATAWWYRRRARRVGVETDTRAFLLTAAVAFAGCVVGTYAFAGIAVELYGAWAANLSILVGSLLVTGLAVWWRRTSGSVVPVFVAALSGAVAFSAVAVYANKGFSALLVIAGGLLVLAWLERSVLLAVVAVLFTLVAVPTAAAVQTAYLWIDVNAVFWYFGWHTDDLRIFTLQQLLLPAAVLLVGGTVALVRKEAVR